MFWRLSEGDRAGLIDLAGYIHSDPGSTVYRGAVFAGLVHQGFWKVRPQDTIGLLFIYRTVSSQLTEAERQDQECELPYGNTRTGVLATGVQPQEEILEANL